MLTQTRVANLIAAGGFDGVIEADEWTTTGSIARSLGYPRLGCAQLDAGESLAQEVGLSEDVLYTAHFFYRLATSATLTVTYGGVSQTFTGTPVDVWREGVMLFALAASANDSLTFAASGGAVYVDTVTLLAGGLPISRSAIAAQLAARLAALATDASLSATASATGPEGDYSYAIDEALRQVGAVNVWGDPDATQLLPNEVNDVIEAAQTALLQRLRATYALETDVSLGPRSESRSQIAGSIDAMLSGGGSDRRLQVGPLTHRDWKR